jgi:hypothetical protein
VRVQLRARLFYLEPKTAENLNVVGYDMYSEPVRHAAMEAAMRRCDPPRMTGRVHLLQDLDPNAAGFLVYAPVFRGGPAPATYAERYDALSGWVYAPVRVPRFVEVALRPIQRNVAFRIIDVTGGAGAPLYADRDYATRTDATFRYEQRASMYGRTWQFEFASAPQEVAAPGLRPAAHGARRGPARLVVVVRHCVGAGVHRIARATPGGAHDGRAPAQRGARACTQPHAGGARGNAHARTERSQSRAGNRSRIRSRTTSRAPCVRSKASAACWAIVMRRCSTYTGFPPPPAITSCASAARRGRMSELIEALLKVSRVRPRRPCNPNRWTLTRMAHEIIVRAAGDRNRSGAWPSTSHRT